MNNSTLMNKVEIRKLHEEISAQLVGHYRLLVFIFGLPDQLQMYLFDSCPSQMDEVICFQRVDSANKFGSYIRCMSTSVDP